MTVNLALSLLKVTAGYFGRSRAVMADGVHNLSDVASDIGLLFCARHCPREPDGEHPYGHGRLELLIGLGIAILMAATGAGLLISSINDLQVSERPPPGLTALIGAIVSLVCKEVLFRWTRAQARRLASPALRANALHHRSDAYSSIPAILAVFTAWTVPAWGFLDSIGGMAVSVLILKLAWDSGWRAFRQLSDRAAPAATVEKIARLTSNIPEVQEVHQIRTRSLGYGWSVDLHLLVDERLSVREGHNIAGQAKSALLNCEAEIVDVIVHIEPAEKTDLT